MSPQAVVWIALGSNQGDRGRLLESAVAALRETPGIEVLRHSPWIETDPVGGPAGQERYWNGVLEARTDLEPRALLERLLAIEAELGRDRRREVPDGPRPIDLDLLLFGEKRIEEPGLIVPHPRMEDRRFVLEPLALLAPERRLPRSGVSVRERLAALVP